MGSGIQYTSEFKIEAVRRVTETSRTFVEVADELSINKDTLRRWSREVRENRLEDDTSDAADDKKELRVAKRKIKELEGQVSFLKKSGSLRVSRKRCDCYVVAVMECAVPVMGAGPPGSLYRQRSQTAVSCVV